MFFRETQRSLPLFYHGDISPVTVYTRFDADLHNHFQHGIGNRDRCKDRLCLFERAAEFLLFPTP
jgi:hypothetical protein